MLGSFTINMDPRNYRRLYRDKAFRQEINLPSGSQASSTLNIASSQSFGNAQAASSLAPYNARGSGNLDKGSLAGHLNTVSSSMNQSQFREQRLRASTNNQAMTSQQL